MSSLNIKKSGSLYNLIPSTELHDIALAKYMEGGNKQYFINKHKATV